MTTVVKEIREKVVYFGSETLFVKCRRVIATLWPNSSSETDEESWTKFVYMLHTTP